MPAHRYVEENSSAAKLATKKSAGVAPEVNLRGHVTCMLPQSTNKAAHSGLKRHQKSKTGVSVAPQKGLMSSKKFLKRRFSYNSGRQEVSKCRTKGDSE